MSQSSQTTLLPLEIPSDFNINSVLGAVRDGTVNELKSSLSTESLGDFKKYLNRINTVFNFNFKVALEMSKEYEGVDEQTFLTKFTDEISKNMSSFQGSLLMEIMMKKYSNPNFNFEDKKYLDQLLTKQYNYLSNIFNDSGVIILTGIPGSGKSTYVENNMKDGDVLLSTDEISLEKLPKSKEKTLYSPLFTAFYSRMEDHLKKKIQGEFHGNIYMDATSIIKKDRETIINIAKKYGVPINCVFLNVHPELSIERDSLRQGIKKVGEKVVNMMFNKLTVPSFDENFDNITKIDVSSVEMDEKLDNATNGFKKLVNSTSDKMDVIEKDIFPYLYEYGKSETLDQKSDFHDEFVGEHIHNVVKNSVDRGFNNDVIIATIFHDLGKLYARKFSPEFGRYTFDRHQDVSAKIMELFYKSRLSSIDGIDFDNIKSIVKYHSFFDKLGRHLDKATEENLVNPDINFSKEGYLKSNIDEFLNKNGFDTKFCIDLFQHWISDKEGAKRTEIELKNYNELKKSIASVIDYENLINISKQVQTVKPILKSFTNKGF